MDRADIADVDGDQNTTEVLRFHYHQQALGCVTEMTEPGGAVVEWVTYDVYGLPTIRDQQGTQVSQSAIGNPYLYTGREYDPESGLYFYRARHYDPVTGRFLQRDPLGYVDSLTLYEYVRSAPTTLRDPRGLLGGETPVRVSDEGRKGAVNAKKEVDRLEREGKITKDEANAARNTLEGKDASGNQRPGAAGDPENLGGIALVKWSTVQRAAWVKVCVGGKDKWKLVTYTEVVATWYIIYWTQSALEHEEGHTAIAERAAAEETQKNQDAAAEGKGLKTSRDEPTTEQDEEDRAKAEAAANKSPDAQKARVSAEAANAAASSRDDVYDSYEHPDGANYGASAEDRHEAYKKIGAAGHGRDVPK